MDISRSSHRRCRCPCALSCVTERETERIIIIDNFCIALFTGVPKLTALYIPQHFLSFTNIVHIIMTTNNIWYTSTCAIWETAIYKENESLYYYLPLIPSLPVSTPAPNWHTCTHMLASSSAHWVLLRRRRSMSLPDSLMTSSARLLASFISTLDPAALGCTAVMSPERPMPWPSLFQTDRL